MMSKDEAVRCVAEMVEYCREFQNYSYYELKQYAFDNRSDWYAVLCKKNYRMTISEYLKSCRQECKRNGISQPTLYESLKRIEKETQ